MDSSNTSTANNTALHFIQWNAHAVSLLEKGNLDDSIHTFRNTLTQLRSFLAENTRDELSVVAEHKNMLMMTSCPLMEASFHQDHDMKDDHYDDGISEFGGCDADDLDHSLPLLESISILLPYHAKALFPDNLLSFYPRAFGLTENHALNTQAPLQDCYAHHLVVLLYNMGLAHQLEAVRPCPKSSQQDQQQRYHALLQQALTLYKAALEITDNYWTEQDMEDFPTLLTAIVNNMGYIHSEVLDFEHARHCIRLVVDLVTGGANCADGLLSCQNTAIPEADQEFFFESIFTYLGTGGSDRVLSLAPAA